MDPFKSVVRRAGPLAASVPDGPAGFIQTYLIATNGREAPTAQPIERRFLDVFLALPRSRLYRHKTASNCRKDSTFIRLYAFFRCVMIVVTANPSISALSSAVRPLMAIAITSRSRGVRSG